MQHFNTNMIERKTVLREPEARDPSNDTVFFLEYIWIDGCMGLRSKTKCVAYATDDITNKPPIDFIPTWNYDGSSTEQCSEYSNTEIVLVPRFVCNDPFRKPRTETTVSIIGLTQSYLVMCDTYEPSGEPTLSNHRFDAVNTFNSSNEYQPLFGLEQEYFIKNHDYCDENAADSHQIGEHYCGVSGVSRIERDIVNIHLSACIYAGLKISGINAEVASSQWEFHIGPCDGITAGDHLYVARYILERIANNCGFDYICYDPKLSPDQNGSSCHINFSTAKMRQYPNGIDEIYDAIDKLELNHAAHMNVYGHGNRLRMTGRNETAEHSTFSHGIGTRNTSIRIGNDTYKNKCGYFEDRRPGANIDPYTATAIIFKTCCLD